MNKRVISQCSRGDLIDMSKFILDKWKDNKIDLKYSDYSSEFSAKQKVAWIVINVLAKKRRLEFIRVIKEVLLWKEEDGEKTLEYKFLEAINPEERVEISRFLYRRSDT